MTNKALMFCALAVSLAVFSISMAPMAPAPTQSRITVQALPIHSLTGVSFHTVAAGF